MNTEPRIFNLDQAVMDCLSCGEYTWKGLQKLLIQTTLKKHGWNRVHTAKALGLSVRCLREKIKRYELVDPCETKLS